MDEAQLKSLLETLADLSLEGETFQICKAALRLQTALMDHYQPDWSLPKITLDKPVVLLYNGAVGLSEFWLEFNMKILDVKWYCSGHGNAGIVRVDDDFEGIKYYIGSFPGEERGHNEEEDMQWIANWGSSFPKDVGDLLFKVKWILFTDLTLVPVLLYCIHVERETKYVLRSETFRFRICLCISPCCAGAWLDGLESHVSRMSDLAIDIQCDLEEGILSFAEIAAKYEVPITWVVEVLEICNE